jgi:hypothetical protein
MGLAGCSPGETSSLLSDAAAESADNVVDKTPKEEEVQINVTTKTIITATADTRADVAGTCYASTYPNHYIQILRDGVAVAIVNGTYAGGAAGTCVQGRFNVTINTTGMGAGGYNYVARIVAVDAAGASHIGQITSAFSVLKQ